MSQIKIAKLLYEFSCDFWTGSGQIGKGFHCVQQLLKQIKDKQGFTKQLGAGIKISLG